MRKRISILEGHLNINEDAYLDLIDQDIKPFCEHVKQLQERSTKTETEEQIDILKAELSKKYVMKTKEVMSFFGFKYYEQAKRLMKKLSEEDENFIFENTKSKTHRIRVKGVILNNVYTNKPLNNMFKQN